MRGWAALGLVLLVACGQASGSRSASTNLAQSASPTRLTSPTPQANATATPQAICGQPAPCSYGILTSRYAVTNGEYGIYVVDTAGKVVANTTYHQRSSLAVPTPPGVPIFLSAPISSSNSRVYYLDGDNDVRMLAPDGTTGVASHLPGNDHVRSAFAVSPDDRRIAVSVIDYSTRPASLRLSVEDLTTGANHNEIFTSTSLYVWPIGWHSGALVVGLGERPIESAAQGIPYFNPYGASSYHLVDAGNATRLAAIGDETCRPTGPLSPAGSACSLGQGQVSVLGWTGRVVLGGLNSGGGVPTGASVEAAGNNVAICCSMGGLIVNQAGAVQYFGKLWGSPLWIDASHVLVGDQPPAQPAPAVLDLGSGLITAVAAAGYVYERIPGSL